MFCAPVTRLDEDALSFASPQDKTFTYAVKGKQKRQSQTARKVKLVLIRPPPGALANPQWHLPTAGPGGDGSWEGLPMGRDEAGLPWLWQGWVTPNVSRVVGRQIGQMIGHFGQQEPLGECSNILNSTCIN